MIVASVSRNTLFAELLSKACEDENFFILKTTSHLLDISECDDSIIVLLHIGGTDTLETVGLKEFRRSSPLARVIAIVDSDVPEATVDALRSHTEAVVQADVSTKALLGFMAVVDAGFQIQRPPDMTQCEDPAAPPAPDVTHRLASHSDTPNTAMRSAGAQPDELRRKARIRLSDRELEIMNLLANGSSNKEIANRLDIVENTVKVHLRSCYSKIGVKNRTQAALWSTRNL